MMLGLWPKIWMLSVVAFLFANANSREDLEELSLDDEHPSPVMYVDEPPNINWKLEESPFIRMVAATKSQEEKKDDKNIPEKEQDDADSEQGKKGKRPPRSVKKHGQRRIYYPKPSRGRRRSGWWGK